METQKASLKEIDNTISWETIKHNKGVRFHVLAILSVGVSILSFILEAFSFSSFPKGIPIFLISFTGFIFLTISLDQKSLDHGYKG